MTSAVHKHFVLKRGFPIKSFPFKTKKFITSPRLLLQNQDIHNFLLHQVFIKACFLYAELLLSCAILSYYPITCYFFFSFGSPCVRRVRRIRSSPFLLFSPCSPNSSCISSQDRWRSSTNATLKVSFTCTRQGQVLGPPQISHLLIYRKGENAERVSFFFFFFLTCQSLFRPWISSVY